MPSNTFYNEILTDHNLHPGTNMTYRTRTLYWKE